jgi:hypothetical protein
VNERVRKRRGANRNLHPSEIEVLESETGTVFGVGVDEMRTVGRKPLSASSQTRRAQSEQMARNVTDRHFKNISGATWNIRFSNHHEPRDEL